MSASVLSSSTNLVTCHRTAAQYHACFDRSSATRLECDALPDAACSSGWQEQPVLADLEAQQQHDLDFLLGSSTAAESSLADRHKEQEWLRQNSGMYVVL